MEAKVISEGTYSDPHEIIEINGHEIQYGGSAGDGFCHSHQSFDCIDNLSSEEKEAVRVAK